MQWSCAQPGPPGCLCSSMVFQLSIAGYVGVKNCNAEGRRGAELLQYPHGSPGVVFGRFWQDPTQFRNLLR